MSTGGEAGLDFLPVPIMSRNIMMNSFEYFGIKVPHQKYNDNIEIFYTLSKPPIVLWLMGDLKLIPTVTGQEVGYTLLHY